MGHRNVNRKRPNSGVLMKAYKCWSFMHFASSFDTLCTQYTSITVSLISLFFIKLSESSNTVVSFCKKLRTGEISFANHPEIVWTSEQEFTAHELNKFLTNFNVLKAKEECSKGYLNSFKFWNWFSIFLKISIMTFNSMF